MSNSAPALPEMPHNPLPREIAPGVFWLGECSPVHYAGKWLHTYNSAFMVVGEKFAAMVETGIPSVGNVVIAQVERILEERGVPLKYIFVTHSEMSHCGSVGRLLRRYPEAHTYGEISDLHLVYPGFEDRIHFCEPGETFDLGGREILTVESVFRDLIHSRWFLDTKERVLFPGDGFAYSHVHDDKECGLFAEEAPKVDIPTQMQRFATLAFHWTGYVDIEPYVQRLDDLFVELGVEIVAPTHGLPIRDAKNSMPIFREGFRGMSDIHATELDIEIYDI